MTPGAENPALYRTVRDILQRQAEVVSVWFEPDAIQKRYVAAEVDPQRVIPSTGPEPLHVEVHWKLTPHTTSSESTTQTQIRDSTVDGTKMKTTMISAQHTSSTRWLQWNAQNTTESFSKLNHRRNSSGSAVRHSLKT